MLGRAGINGVRECIYGSVTFLCSYAPVRTQADDIASHIHLDTPPLEVGSHLVRAFELDRNDPSTPMPLRRGAQDEPLRFRAHHQALEQRRVALCERFDPLLEHEAKTCPSRVDGLQRGRALLVAPVSIPEHTSLSPPRHLSPRELEVLRLVVAGRHDREIAAVLQISPRTVQTHVASLLSKFGVNSRVEVAAIAVRRGLV